MDPDARTEEEQETNGPLTEKGRDALTGLRAIWSATGQMQEELTILMGRSQLMEGEELAAIQHRAHLGCRPDPAGCAASVGFYGFADTVEPTANTTDAIARLRSAWKTTLAREGKLYEPEADRLNLMKTPTGEVRDQPE
jgi:hypothetical protein